MTSDAKIGLLLGLVFIFVIAFIINGLPNLRPQTTRAEVPTNMNTVNLGGGEFGIGGQARTQVDQDRTTRTEQQEPEQAVQPVAEQVTPAVEPPASQTATANGQDVRFEAPLPGTETPAPRIENPLTRIENLLERLTAGQQNQREQTVSTVNMDVPSSVVDQPVAAERQSAIQTSPMRTEVRPAEAVTRAAEQPKPTAVTPARQTVTPLKPLKIYVVGEGESLSTVAKNVYGAEEGNRYVNINRIYEANKDVLKSVHEVVAGQKLVIPALPKPTINPDKPSDVLPKELFERLEPLRKPALTQTAAPSPTQTQKPAATQTPKPAAAPTGEGRWYTIQDGDNLWKIASSQLGAGARYEEIAKLNAELLKGKEVLDVGMKIRLPAK